MKGPMRFPLCPALRLVAAVMSLTATPALARDALGVFGAWAAFRDAAVPRCYAIAQPDHVTSGHTSNGAQSFKPYADVGSWPTRNVRGAFHLRLARRTAPNTPITLPISGQHFALVGGGGDAWAANPRMDAAITAAMRSAETMSVSARDPAGQTFGANWKLSGAATAMDSALVGCAGLK